MNYRSLLKLQFFLFRMFFVQLKSVHLKITAYTILVWLIAATDVSAEDTNSTLAQSRAEFDRALLKTRVMDPHCLPLPSVLEGGNIRLIDPVGAKGALKEDGYWKADVIVGDTGKTNHLLLQTDSDTIWSLTVDRFAELGSIIVFGSGHGVVAGVPDGTLVYSLDRNADGSRALPCKTRDKAEKDLERTLSVFGSSMAFPHWAIRMNRLNGHLDAYAGVRVDSIIRPNTPDQRAYANIAAIGRTSWARALGQKILRYADVPLQGVHSLEAPVSVPEGLTGVTMKAWLLENEYAEEVGGDFVDFLCLRENAEAISVGYSEAIPDHKCWAREYSFASQQVVLRRSIDLGGFYQCEDSERLIINVPKALSVEGRFVSCKISLQEF